MRPIEDIKFNGTPGELIRCPQSNQLVNDAKGNNLVVGDTVEAWGNGDEEEGSNYYGYVDQCDKDDPTMYVQVHRHDGETGGGTAGSYYTVAHMTTHSASFFDTEMGKKQTELPEEGSSAATAMTATPKVTDVDPETVEFYHDAIDEILPSGVQFVNKLLSEAGTEWRMGDAEEERMSETLKSIVPFFSPPETWLLMSMLEKMLQLTAGAALVEALGLEDEDEISALVTKVLNGASPEMLDHVVMDASDKDKILARMSAAEAAEEVVFNDEEEDPADAIMRKFRLSNN